MSPLMFDEKMVFVKVLQKFFSCYEESIGELQQSLCLQTPKALKIFCNLMRKSGDPSWTDKKA